MMLSIKKIIVLYIVAFASLSFISYFFLTISSGDFHNKIEHERINLQNSFQSNANTAANQQVILKSFDFLSESVVNFTGTLFAAVFFLNVIVLTYAFSVGLSLVNNQKTIKGSDLTIKKTGGKS